jgi:hypothetical protein
MKTKPISPKALALGGARRPFAELTAATVSDPSEIAYPTSPKRMRGEKGPTRIMFIENKSGQLTGGARIGRVSFSKSGSTLYYNGRKFQSLKGAGFKANYFDVETRETYWISGPKRNGQDFLNGGGGAEIDEDCRQEYWTAIRGRPDLIESKTS